MGITNWHIFQSSDGETFSRVAKILSHPNYNEASGLSDIAIVSLESPATLGTNVSVVCLPPVAPSVPLFDGASLMTAGWKTFDSSKYLKSRSSLCLFENGPRPLFSLFSYVNSINVQYTILTMTGFESWTSWK